MHKDSPNEHEQSIIFLVIKNALIERRLATSKGHKLLIRQQELQCEIAF